MGTISFARGVPAPECLPAEELADCARAALERDGRTILSYGPSSGYAPLRDWIAARHDVDPARVFITNGSLQGFVFLAQRLAPGKRVLVERPTYDRPLKILKELGAEVVALECDEEGLDPDALERELRTGPAPAFLYLIPTFQNPSGRTLPLERRRRLVELAREHALTVLEDDPYGRVRFDGEPLPTLHELDGGEHVLYSSSFSKIVAPGARVGYFVLSDEVAGALESVAQNIYLTPVLIGQATVFEFIRRGSLEPNVARVSGLLRARRDAMLEALDRELPDARISRPEGGYFVWLDLPESIDVGEFLPGAEEAGVTFVQGSDFFPAGSGGGRSSARLAFSYVSPDEIREGVSRLAGLLAPALPV
jgi:DNA-binding transcriptional MocR family regulator